MLVSHQSFNTCKYMYILIIQYSTQIYNIHIAIWPYFHFSNGPMLNRWNIIQYLNLESFSNRFESILRMVSHIPLPPRLDIHSFRSPTANIPGLVEIVEEDDEFSPLEDIEVEDMDASEGWGIWIQWFEWTCATWPDVTPMKGLEFAFAERVDLILTFQDSLDWSSTSFISKKNLFENQ